MLPSTMEEIFFFSNNTKIFKKSLSGNLVINLIHFRAQITRVIEKFVSCNTMLDSQKNGII